MWIVFAILAVALVLFVTELLPIDLTALLIMVALIGTRVLTPQEGISGFASTAPITVAAVLVLSAGLLRTGAVARLGDALSRLGGRNETAQMVVLLLTVGILSGFINNTAAVAMFIPLVLGIARRTGISPSKLLIPLSFTAILGGLCTYIGTSTNIIVGSALAKNGQEPFTMFEFTKLGAILLVIGLVYLLSIGRRFLPDRRSQESLTDDYRLKNYLTELVIQPASPLIGKTLQETQLGRTQDIEVLEVRRDKKTVGPLLQEVRFKEGDLLIVKGNIERIMGVRGTSGVEILPEVKLSDSDLKSRDVALAEVIISVNSDLIGLSLKQIDFRQAYQATVLAIRRHGEQIRNKLGDVRLQMGDMLLLQGKKARLQSLKESPEFLLVMDDLPDSRPRKRKMVLAVGIFLAVVVMITFQLQPLLVAVLGGAAMMVMTRCLTIQEAYEAIDWRIIMLIAGTLSLGEALSKTGGAQLIADSIIDWVGPYGPRLVLAALYLLTMVLTELMSNNATASLLAPIALSLAEGMGVDPRPFAVAVAVGASASFLSPIGYQTNTLVYGPGGYRFTDFGKVGAPISLMVWILASWLIPVFWPF